MIDHIEELQREALLICHSPFSTTLKHGINHVVNPGVQRAVEYVDGQAIDLFAAGESVQQKVVLFREVCAAVSYLHQNLVIHGDLKPANILVTPDGEPKLLDLAATGMHLLTLDYASPEQVTGGPITTTTDVYSLGAVLYKLLTGISPHRVNGDSYPAIASTVSLGKIARPAQLAPGLHRDLQAIVLKALRREPHERYATVEQFSDDLANYLASRPIQARQSGAWYQTRKFLRRHWAPVVVAALAIADLSAGMFLANQAK